MTVPSSQPSTAEQDSGDKLCKTQKLLQANKECSSFFVFKIRVPESLKFIHNVFFDTCFCRQFYQIFVFRRKS
jgi:hypothetical protein